MLIRWMTLVVCSYYVPAFSGLLAPHWQPDARGYVRRRSQGVFVCVCVHDCECALEGRQ